jgi:hypothetical protein
MVHTTPTKVLVATTLRPLVGPLSGSLAQGVRLIQQGLREEPTPQKMATFEGELNALWREGGRRRMAWVVNHLEPEHTAAAPSRVQWEGRLYPSTREISERYRDARWSRGRLATPLCTAGPWGPCPPAVGTPSRTCRRARPPGVRRVRWAVGSRSPPTASPGDVGEGPQCPWGMHLAAQGAREPERGPDSTPPCLAG